MNTIEDLLKQYCPNGVESKLLWEVTTWDKRFNAVDNYKQSRIIKYTYLLAADLKNLQVENGDIKLLTTSNTDLWTTEELAGENVSEGEVVAIPWGGTAIVQYYKGKFLTADNRLATSLDSQILDTKFLYYFMLNKTEVLQSYYRGSGIKHPSMAKVLDMKIPLPPLEIQLEIVKILDAFTYLNSEILAELEYRKKQHAFYWEQLLSVKDSWQATTLGCIADIYDGPHATPKKTEVGPWYLSISSLKNGRIDIAESAHLDEQQYKTWIRRVAPEIGDTLFSYETRIGQAAFWNIDEPAALGRRMGLLRPKTDMVHPRFLTLLYLGPEFQKLIRTKTISGSTVDRIPIAKMAFWEVNVPSLEEQEEIIRQVDTFDALVNDKAVGLPALISARRKQYAFYRNRLLTFQELQV